MTAPRRCVSSPAPLPGLRSPRSSPGPPAGTDIPRYLPRRARPPRPTNIFRSNEQHPSANKAPPPPIPQPPPRRGSSLPTAPTPLAAGPGRAGKEDAPTILAGKRRRGAARSAEDARARPGCGERLPCHGAGTSRRAHRCAQGGLTLCGPRSAPGIPSGGPGWSGQPLRLWLSISG